MASNHRVVALTVGTANIVAVQGLVKDAPQGERTAVVEKVATVPTPTGAVRSNGIHLPSAVVEALRTLWRDHGLQTKNVIMGVDSRRLQSGVKWLPYMTPKDLADVAKPEWIKSKQIIPGVVDEKNSTVNHFVLRERTSTDPASASQSRQMLLMAINSPKTEAQALANIAEDAGLELVGMDLIALGLLRAARLPVRKDRRVVDMLVDLGETFTTMVLHNNGNVRAVRTVDGTAGGSVTRGIADDLRRLGRKAEGRDTDAQEAKHALAAMLQRDPNGDVTRKVMNACVRQANSLREDIVNFLSQYIEAVNEVEEGSPAAQLTEERGMSSVALAGGGSFLHDLSERLADKESGGFDVVVNHASIAQAYAMHDGSPVPHHWDGVSIVSTVGLLTADRKAI